MTSVTTEATAQGATQTAPAVVGRDTAPIYRGLCALLAFLAAAAGIIAVAGSHYSDVVWAWQTASPLNLLLLGAVFMGAIPLMAGGALAVQWEYSRIAVIPGIVLVAALFVGTVRYLGDTYIGGGALISLLFSAIWLLALGLATLIGWLGIVFQWRELAVPMARVQPLPRWTTPVIAIQGAAWFGLGFALLVRPELGHQWVPWEVSDLDVAALAAMCLTLGVALLQALAEDDLDRVKPGLIALIAIGFFGLVSFAVSFDAVDWVSWTGPIPALMLLVLMGTGIVGVGLTVLHSFTRRRTREE